MLRTSSSMNVLTFRDIVIENANFDGSFADPRVRALPPSDGWTIGRELVMMLMVWIECGTLNAKALTF